jgi:hypothetical protein
MAPFDPPASDEPSPARSANPLRCAVATRAGGVDPVGTAGTYAGYLLLEWPLPWPRDIGDVAALAAVHDALAGTGIRLQALVPPDADDGARRVALFRRPDDALFGGFERIERAVPADRVVAEAVDLVTAAKPGPDRPPADVRQDVLICTHGQRDVCCGSMGTGLARDLLADHDSFGDDVRLWRTSHTGGHRFAPTAIVLPQGTVWAFLDAGAVRRIVAREGPLDDLLPRYRGCSGVGPPTVQAVEREVFGEIGWPWLAHRRQGRVLADGRVRLDASTPDGSTLAWEATVEAGRIVPVPECGRPLDEARKSETEWRVTDLRPVRTGTPGARRPPLNAG